MSCNLTAIGLEIQKATRIHIGTRTKQNIILFETRIVIVLFISTKNVDTNIND